MSDFLKLTPAAKRTGKSTSTLRRLAKAIGADDGHPDRSHVRPSPEEVWSYQKEGIQFTWEISEELLDREYPPSTKQRNAGSETALPVDRLIDTLQDTIGELKNQLGEKDEQLHDRAREVERLQNSLQHAQMVQSQLAQKAGLPAPVQHENPTQDAQVTKSGKRESIWTKHYSISDLFPWKK